MSINFPFVKQLCSVFSDVNAYFPRFTFTNLRRVMQIISLDQKLKFCTVNSFFNFSRLLI